MTDNRQTVYTISKKKITGFASRLSRDGCKSRKQINDSLIHSTNITPFTSIPYVKKCIARVLLIFTAGILLFSGCAGIRPASRHLTERLFLEQSRIGITHFGGNSPGNNPGSALVLGEQVSYTPQPVTSDESDAAFHETARLDTNRVYSLSAVTVTSRARFAPVRQGQVNVEFLIKVPAAYLSEDFQLCLSPVLFHNDSVVPLEDVVLRGKNFVALQQQDYQRFDDYLAGIVAPTVYDSVFVDHRHIERELTRRRQSGLGSYYGRWVRMQEYREWRNREQEKYDAYNIRQAANLREKLRKHDTDYNVSAARLLATGQDTARLGYEYRQKRNKIIASAPARRQITLASVPAKFREFYIKGIGPEDLEPELPNMEDSVRIAGSALQHEKIAANELRSARQQEIFKYMVPSPHRPDARYNGVVVTGRDYAYRYTQPYPVTPGLKNLRVTLSGNITATDRSMYHIRNTDTLSFIISSLDELADGNLLSRGDITPEQRLEYTFALELLRKREYQRALAILNEYKDYNTALALTCLGYDSQAYRLLRQLEKNANTHYLGALLCYRLNSMQEAVDNLMEACRLDGSKITRIPRDPEISKMVSDFKLQDQIDALDVW